ncbi:hypothetical protein Glove_362g64 [Diversispora epigaea]|uniref:Serine-threonine/tyrosine-protein kinase catalytic domain-containing protein n=1 Tax=Diversispora epigaea TaxID=1348612 RepID=A0A397HCH4_9GLOM|nr:hypothetical protein Glove_362g64 [Diversispora epigaea]
MIKNERSLSENENNFYFLNYRDHLIYVRTFGNNEIDESQQKTVAPNGISTREILYSALTASWYIDDLGFSDGETPSDYDLALAIINGRRPKIYEDIPVEHATLMKLCWDTITDNRPDSYLF